MVKRIISICVAITMTTADTQFTFPSEFTPSSFYVSFNSEIDYDHIKIFNRLSLFSLSHPQMRYIPNNYERANTSAVTEISYFQIRTGNASLLLGRNYISSGPCKVNAPIFASRAPSMDQISFKWEPLSLLNFSYSLIRLDNRPDEAGTFNRWLYFRRIQLEITRRVSIGVKDAVLATGIKRGIELNYLNPGAIFQLEQLQGRAGPKDGTPQINNDNQLIGVDLNINLNKISLYMDMLVDEFQIDAQDRTYKQDVFAFTLGVSKYLPNSMLVMEYFYASPWMYLNGGMYTNVEFEGYPLGLPGPLSQGLYFAYTLDRQDFEYSLSIWLRQNGSQGFDTIYDTAYNYKGFFDFHNKISQEISASINFVNFKYLDFLRASYNLLDNNKFTLTLGLNYSKQL